MRGAEIALANMCCCRLLVRTWAAAAGVSGRRAPAAPIFCSSHAGGVAARPALSLRRAPASTAPGRTHAPREHNHVTFCCAYLPTVCKRQALPALPCRCNTGELYKESYHLVSATPRSSPNDMSISACARSRVQGVPSASSRLAACPEVQRKGGRTAQAIATPLQDGRLVRCPLASPAPCPAEVMSPDMETNVNHLVPPSFVPRKEDCGLACIALAACACACPRS